MSTFNMQNFYRPSPLNLDNPHTSFFENDDDSILDENILDHSALDSGLEMSPPMNNSRRDSFNMFSPKTEEWHQMDVHAQQQQQHHHHQHQQQQQQQHHQNQQHSNNPFMESNSNNPFMRLDSQQAATYGQQWTLAQTSGSCTPMQSYDGLPSEFDNNAQVFQRPMPNQTPFSNPNAQVQQLFSSASTNGSIPGSPQVMGADSMEFRAMPKRMRPHSPMLRSHSPLLRRDGIRKKNARFDIPAERNLLNIDQLIAQSNDEQEIKELKQQKRLLRNRQAALDSRQRKKQHTERLEDEKKQYTAVINDLEEELAEAKLAMDEAARKEQQYLQYIEALRMEKEEMVRSHTIETGDLRKKVSVLTEHVQKVSLESSTAMSAVPSSTGFNPDYNDIDSLTMEGAWDNISFLNDFPLEDQIKAEPTSTQAKKNDAAPVESEKPAAQGLLLMLLLVGAFVASSKGSSPHIPKISDDVREASATLLQDIFKDAGVQNAHGALSVANAAASVPTTLTWPANPSLSLGGSEMVGVNPSRLGDMVDALAQPSEEQKNEQLFSMTAEQYNGLTSQEFLREPAQPSTSAGRRNLGEALAAMRSNSKQSAAEVYTRSLLWDQVPSEVVRNFAKLVEEQSARNEDTAPSAVTA